MTDPDSAQLAEAAVARDIRIALRLARDLASDLDLGRDLDRDLVRNLELKLASAIDRARDLDYATDSDLELASELASVIDHARERTHAIALELTSARARAQSRAIEGDYYTVEEAPDRGFAHDLAHASDRARAFSGSLDSVSTNARLLASIVSGARAGGHSGGAAARLDPGRQVAPSAARVAAAAARMLPAAGRPRWAEEWRSEQWELARAGASRWTQLAYAGRLLRSAVSLRRALRDPSWRRAAP